MKNLIKTRWKLFVAAGLVLLFSLPLLLPRKSMSDDMESRLARELGLKVQTLEPKDRIFLVDHERRVGDLACIRRSDTHDWNGVVEVINLNKRAKFETSIEESQGRCFEYRGWYFWGDPEIIVQIRYELVK